MHSEVERVLRLAGWSPGRRVSVAKWQPIFERENLEMHASARRFLAEYGDLAIPEMGPGITRSREAIDLDPLQAEGEGGLFVEWSEQLHMRLYPIGVLDRGRYFLGLGETAGIYLLSDWVAYFGEGDAGLENLVLGVMPEVITE